MAEVVLLVDGKDNRSYGISSYCRICHEAELESSSTTTLEVPCACSGTVKYAHRECIQRWCNQKGNTVCEICLQNYEPGYTAPSKKAQLQEFMTIGDGMEISMRENDTEEEGEEEELVAEGIIVDAAYSNCTNAADRSASLFRSLAVTLTLLLLLKDLLTTCAKGTGDYPFTLLTILILRASGIVLPMYILFWTVAAICKNIRKQYQYSGRNNERTQAHTEEEQLHLV